MSSLPPVLPQPYPPINWGLHGRFYCLIGTNTKIINKQTLKKYSKTTHPWKFRVFDPPPNFRISLWPHACTWCVFSVSPRCLFMSLRSYMFNKKAYNKKWTHILECVICVRRLTCPCFFGSNYRHQGNSNILHKCRFFDNYVSASMGQPIKGTNSHEYLIPIFNHVL